MTDPIPVTTGASASTETPATAVAAALVQNAGRLGLTWDLKPATIGDTSATITVVIDGDSAAISAQNMLGEKVIAGDRVYVVVVPPAGNFIVGRQGINYPPYLRLAYLGVTLAGSANNFLLWTTTLANTGHFSVDSGTGIITFRKRALYSVTISVQTLTVGIANSRQSIIAAVTTTFASQAADYRTYWSIGEQDGTLTISPLALDQGDTLRANFLQNSAVNMTGSSYLSIVQIGDMTDPE